MKKTILVILPVVIVVAAAVYTIIPKQTYRAIFMALPAVDDVSDECIFNNVIDIIEAYLNGTLFTAEEYISLSCSAGTRNYTAEVYLSLNPVDENRIERLLNDSEPVLNVSGQPIYFVSGNKLLFKEHSTLHLFLLNGFDEQEITAIIDDAMNLRDYYDLSNMLLILERIPDRADVIDSTLYQKQVFVSENLTTALKGWYIGTTRLASQQGFVALRQPREIEMRCYDYDNETTPYGSFYKCFGNGTCGPKYLVLNDAVAYAMDANDMYFTCSSVEDAFTDSIMRNTR